jgi:hypothetical protein
MTEGVFLLGAVWAASAFLAGMVWRLRPDPRRRLHQVATGLVGVAAVLWLLSLPVWIAGPALLPALACTVVHLLVHGRRWGKPVLLLLFVVNLGLLFPSFWYLASPENTWGNGNQLAGLVATSTLLLSSQTLALAHGAPRPIGFGKVALGAAMLFSIAGFGFQRSEWVNTFTVDVRWGILVTCLGLIVEGMLLATMTPGRSAADASRSG